MGIVRTDEQKQKRLDFANCFRESEGNGRLPQEIRITYECHAHWSNEQKQTKLSVLKTVVV